MMAGHRSINEARTTKTFSLRSSDRSGIYFADCAVYSSSCFQLERIGGHISIYGCITTARANQSN